MRARVSASHALRIDTVQFGGFDQGVWGWANGHPGMNNVVVNAQTDKRGDGAATMDYLKA